MVRRSRSRSRRGGNEPPNAPAPNAPNANNLAEPPVRFNMSAFDSPAPPLTGVAAQLRQDAVNAGLIGKGRRTRRRHRRSRKFF